MLQIDHIYEFLSQSIFKDFSLLTLPLGVLPDKIPEQIDINDVHLFNLSKSYNNKMVCWDQEPVLEEFIFHYLNGAKKWENTNKPYVLITSERSELVSKITTLEKISSLYYFFHGFAALDWYRGFYALNYNKNVIQNYPFDFITFNRITNKDRSYRCYFVSKLVEHKLTKYGQISFGVDALKPMVWKEELESSKTKLSEHAKNHIYTHLSNYTRPMIIDSEKVLGTASADIPRCINSSFWHIVTETVFYYDKLHLTEKIFKPIVMKQPFMLLAAPGNLAYLKDYGFKTFNNIIDESYDTIQDPDARTDAVVKQLHWYCNLSRKEKTEIIKEVSPIVEYNFHHFYGEFKHIITSELLDNCKVLFKEIGYDDRNIAYSDIYKVLTS